jgi:hypothetical protein
MQCRVITFGLLVTSLAYASAVPESTDITPGNAQELGFGVEVLDAGYPEGRMVRVTFPLLDHNGCQPGRVQSGVMDLAGNELSASSFDYTVRTIPAAVLLNYEPAKQDMLFQVQYCCDTNKYTGCKYAYANKSVSAYIADLG